MYWRAKKKIKNFQIQTSEIFSNKFFQLHKNKVHDLIRARQNKKNLVWVHNSSFVKLLDSYLSGGTAAVHGVSSDNVLSVRRPVQPQHMGRPSTLLHTHTHAYSSGRWCCGDPEYVRRFRCRVLIKNYGSVADQDPVPFWLLDPGSGMSKKNRIRDEHPGSYFLEQRNNFF